MIRRKKAQPTPVEPSPDTKLILAQISDLREKVDHAVALVEQINRREQDVRVPTP